MFIVQLEKYTILPIVQRVPLHPVAQVHVPGLEHVPPFEHAGVQTAKGNGMF